MTPKHRKLIISIGLILLIGFLGIFVFGAKQAHAAWGMESFIKSVLFTIGFILDKLFWLLGQLLNAIAGIVNGILDQTNFTTDPIVKAGWGIVRDLTNMFFVLILLIIAFSTILRIEGYGMKKLLTKLIIAALLINFSLVLAGPIIDFSQILTEFFIDKIEEKGCASCHPPTDPIKLSTAIANALSLPKMRPNIKICTKWREPDKNHETTKWNEFTFCNSNPNATKSDYCLKEHGICESWRERTKEELKQINFVGKTNEQTLNIIMGLIMANIFMVVALFVFAAFAFFLIARILTLWFLLIIAPIAWLFSILPNTEHLFKQWWNTFLKWCFFAPIYMFFVYLALNQLAVIGSPNLTTGVETNPVMPKLLDSYQLLRFVMVIGILVGGLIVAQKMSIYGAGGAINIAKGIRKGAAGMAKGAGIGTAKWGYKRTKQAAARPMGKIGEGLQKKLGKVPGLRQLARPFRTFAEKERGTVAESEKKYKDWTSNNLKSQYKAVDPRGKTAITKILAERGDFEANKSLGFTEKDIKKATILSKKYNKHKDILKARPDLSPLIREANQSPREAIEKTISRIKPTDLDKLQPKSLTPEIIQVITNELSGKDGKWNSSHLSKMSAANPILKIKIKKEIIDDPNRRNFLRKDVDNYLKSEAGKAIYE